MNEADARAAIRGRLKFGDERQIAAVRFLEAVQEVVNAIHESPECSNCYGTGKGDRPWIECRYCLGVGHFLIGSPSERDDVLTAAITKVKREKES